MHDFKILDTLEMLLLGVVVSFHLLVQLKVLTLLPFHYCCLLNLQVRYQGSDGLTLLLMVI